VGVTAGVYETRTMVDTRLTSHRTRGLSGWQAARLLKESQGVVGGSVTGEKGSWMTLAADWPCRKVDYEGTSIRADDELGHWDESERVGRSLSSPNWHGLNAEVWTACWEGTPESEHSPRLRYLLDVAQAAFELTCPRWFTGDTVVVTSWAWASNDRTTKPVTHWVDGAQRGLIFASELGVVDEAQWCQSSEATGLGDGLIACPECLTMYMVGDSGPSDHLPPFPCGHKLATGDHRYRDDLIVLERGKEWTSCRDGVAHPVKRPYADLLREGVVDEMFLVRHGHIVVDRKQAVHDDWDVILLPLRPEEGRFLANIRLLPLVCGRSDVNIVTMNVRGPPPDRAIARTMESIGILHGSVGRGWSPVDAGAFWAAGATFWPDKQEYLGLMARWGLVYGVEEGFLLQRAPNIVPRDCPEAFEGWKSFTYVEKVTWYQKDEDDFWAAYPIPRTTVHTVLSGKRGRWPQVEEGFQPHRNSPHLPIKDAIAAADADATRAGIPLEGYNIGQVSRRGGRYATSYVPDVGDVGGRKGEIVPGSMWRRFDNANTLRSAYATTRTQGLSEQVWDAILHEDGIVSPWFVDRLQEAVDDIDRYLDDVDLSGLVLVASVWSQKMLDEFYAARRHLSHRWIFLTERPDLVAPEYCVVLQLPTNHGTAFVFQLARLLPFAGRFRDDVFLSVINDLETDWFPREDRLTVGAKCMSHMDIVFPAMGMNTPCPFQDVYGRAGSLAKLRQNLVWTCAALGWIYGVDEVWACAHMLPTVAVEWKLGGAATRNFSNPKDATLVRVVPDGLEFYQVPKGRYAEIFGMRGVVRPAIRSSPETDTRCPTRTLALSEWESTWERRFSLRKSIGRAVLVVFVWGTRGDRIPMVAAAKKMRETGAEVALVELATELEGRQGLEFCETERGYLVLAGLAAARAVLERCRVPFLHPSYMGRVQGGLGFVLRPTSLEAGRPRGGLPAWIDWVIPLINWEAEDIFVAAADEGMYFPRSCNGDSFLQPRTNARNGRRAVVAGSSTIPVPAEYKDWPICPPGDHSELLTQYEEIACAGGAGVVQTARACGCKVKVWSRVIDRQWFNPDDAGRPVTKTQQEDRWYLPIVYFYPVSASLLVMRPRLWVFAAKWLLSLQPIGRLAWAVLFVVTCMRNQFLVMPTIDATIARFVLGPGGGIMMFLSGRILVKSVRLYRAARGYTWFKMTLQVITTSARVVISPAFSLLTTMGTPWREAYIYALCLNHLPSVTSFFGQIRSGRIGATQSGVWVGWTPVMLGWVPVGLHVVVYDATTGRIMQGRHRSRNSMELGGDFCFVVTEAEYATMPIWIQTHLASSDLPMASGPAAPYSLLWNCQTQVAMLLLRSGKPIGGLLLISTLLGVVSAMTALAVATLVMLFAGTASLTALYALRPVRLFGLEWEVVARAVWQTATSLTPLFADGGLQDDVDDDDLRNIKEYSTRLATLAIQDGVPQDITFEAIARMWAVLLAGHDGSTFAQRRPHVVSGITGARETKEALAQGLIRSCLAVGIPLRIIEALARVTAAGIEGIVLVFSAGAFALAQLLDTLDHSTGGRLSRDLRELIEIIANEGCRLGGRRMKNAWAPLAPKEFDRLRFVDWVTLGLPGTMSPQDDDGNPFLTTIRNLNRFVPKGQEPLPEDIAYQRAVFLPRRPRATEFELKYPSLISSVSAVVDPTLQERAERYERMGATPGTDGVWLATDELRERQLTARYLPEGRPWNAQEEALMEATVSTLYDAHREAFEAPGVVTPETVARNLITKYSPGLPFIPRFKTRKDLWQTGWMDSIIQATYAALEEGYFPPELYHAFPKMQIVKKNREVTAEGLPSVFVAQVAQLEMTKRSFWNQANMGMGAPITARYLGQVFEKVNKRKMAFTADASDFDSNCPPILFEALTRFYEKGVQDGGIPAVAQIQRAKYVRMQKATIVDLPTGRIFPKNRGGATGQSATSWDNHWAFRVMMVMIWSYATGEHPDQFYSQNTVHNTGDDDIWGTDSDVTPGELATAAKELFGIELKIERMGDVTQLSYLSRIPIRTQDCLEEAEIAGLTDQEFVTRPDRERFLLRRSAVLSRYSGRPIAAFAQAQTQRNIGHLLNCAFDHELYSMILREYMEDVETYIGVKGAIVWKVQFGENGMATSCHPGWRKGFSPSPTLVGRFRQLSSSLRAPSYKEVLEKQGKKIEAEPRPSKFAYARYQPSFERVMRIWVSTFRFNLNSLIPDALTKLAVTPDSAPIAPLLWTPGWPVEKYVWRAALRGGETLTVEQLSARTRQSPFAPPTDPAGFYWFLQIPGVEEALLKEDFHVVRGKMVVAYLVYLGVNSLVAFLRRIPLIGLLMEGFLIYQADIPRLYAALSSLHWVATAEISPVVSALMPRDAYASYKIAAVWGTLLCPDTVAALASRLLPEHLTSAIIDSIAMIKNWAWFDQMDAAKGVRPQNHWDGYAPQLLADARDHPPGVTVVAQTATGKSTMFPASLLGLTHAQVWLLLPRVILTKEYQNPWLTPDTFVRLAKDAKDDGSRLKVCTYGHYLARVRSGMGPRDDDIVLMDEFGEREPDMGLAYFATRQKKFLLSATPSRLYSPDSLVRVIPIPRPFEEPTPIRLGLPVTGLIQEALADHPGPQRLLVIVPGIGEAQEVTQALRDLGRVATTLWAGQPRVPASGDIVATQVVDSGIDIPGITLLIDKGVRVVQNQGITQVLPTDPSTDIQRRGRTGRRSQGWVYTTLLAGTGTQPTPYPSYTRIMEEVSARAWLFARLGIEDTTAVYPFGVASRIDHRMRIHTEEALTTNELVSLSAWWALACNRCEPWEADKAYDRITLRGWTDTDEGISQMLNRAFGQTGLLPRQAIAHILAEHPFRVTIGGVERSPTRMRIENGSVHAL
jgi:hypothetical protein